MLRAVKRSGAAQRQSSRVLSRAVIAEPVALAQARVFVRWDVTLSPAWAAQTATDGPRLGRDGIPTTGDHLDTVLRYSPRHIVVFEERNLPFSDLGCARAVRPKHSPPRDLFSAVRGHHAGDEARRALVEILRDVPVGHHSAGGDRVDDVQDEPGEHRQALKSAPLRSVRPKATGRESACWRCSISHRVIFSRITEGDRFTDRPWPELG